MVGIRVPGRRAAPGRDATTLPGTARSVDYPAGHGPPTGRRTGQDTAGAVSAMSRAEYAKRLAGITW